MNIRCYIVDDQSLVLDLLQAYVDKTEGLVLAGRETDPNRAATRLLDGSIEADVVFLDIDMPGLSGMELANMVSHIVRIVFTTAHRQYAPEAFEVNAVDYMMKPLSYERFLKGVDKIREALGKRENELPDYIFVPGDGKSAWIKITLEDIMYIKSDSNYLHIVTEQKEWMSYMTMDSISQELPKKYFYRIHKSYIVNIRKVAKVDPQTVYLISGTELPIGRSYKNELLDRIIKGK